MISAKVVGVQDLIDELEKIGFSMDLDRNDFATRMMDVSAACILENMDQECDPDGSPWPALSPSYLEWKAEIAPQAPIGVLYGIMKTWDQIAGERAIGAAISEMTYGTDTVAKVEAVKFSLGGIVTGTAQPPREFYGLTHSALIYCEAVAEDVFSKAW